MKTEDAVALLKSIRMRELNGWEKDFVFSMKGRVSNGKEIKAHESKKLQEIYRSSWDSTKEDHQEFR